MKKIMFSDAYGLTEAVLSGRKTQTRRIASRFIPDAIQIGYNRLEIFNGKELRCYKVDGSFIKYKLPYHVGEVIAVAQCYKDIVEHLAKKAYDVAEWMDDHNITKDMAGWLNKMFVKASLMIFKIRITNVRVERLQDISDEDCEKEGLRVFKNGFACFDDKKYIAKSNIFSTPREAYAALIDRISGKGTWESNPWVFVYNF